MMRARRCRVREATSESQLAVVSRTERGRYFGRAKDLPGVKEMFTRTGESDRSPIEVVADLAAQQMNEDTARNATIQRFRNQGTEYFGDNDEMDEGLTQEEDELARQGRQGHPCAEWGMMGNAG